MTNKDNAEVELDKILARVQLGGTWVDKYPKMIDAQSGHKDIAEAKTQILALLKDSYSKGKVDGAIEQMQTTNEQLERMLDKMSTTLHKRYPYLKEQ